MNYKHIIIALGLITVGFSVESCNGCSSNKDEVTPLISPYDDEDETLYAQSGDEIVVPYRNDNGVKYVQVKVNGVGFETIFDTGCSGALISIAEAKYLYEKGKLTEEDFLGTARSQIADGSIVENMVVNLKEVIIDDKVLCPNVEATVSGNINAPLLLGNEILDRVAAITIDNQNQTLKFKIK